MAGLSNPSLWIGLAGAILSIGLVAAYLRSIVRQWGKREGGWKSRLALGRSVFGLALAVLLAFLLGTRVSHLVEGSTGLRGLEGKPAPELRFAGMPDGRPGGLSEHRGQVVLVNFWATWCPPCRKEMPALDRLQTSYRDRGLVVLHLSEEPSATIADYLRASPMSTRHGVAHPLPWPSYALPTTFLVDREGVIRRIMVGARSYESFERLVREYL